MVRHTLSTLGPKVLAGRMVREYVTRLYAPAARAHRLAGGGECVELAAWKRRVREQWPMVAVDHVETGASVGGSPELGTTLTLRVQVALGGLEPGDVDVQVVSGRVDESDRIADPTVVSSSRADGRTWRAAGSSRARSPSTAPDPSATPSASCRRTGCSPRSPSSG